MKSTPPRPPSAVWLANTLALSLSAVIQSNAHAQDPRLHIHLERPPALASVGSVLVAPNGRIVVNHDGFGGYQEGAIFVLDSSGHLLRVIEATPIPALPYPVWLAPAARAILPDGSLIVDYAINRHNDGQVGPLRVRLDPKGVVVTPGADDPLPLGAVAVQEGGGLVVAPSPGEWGVPLIRFLQETQGERRGLLSLDQNFFNRVRQSSGGQYCAGLATGADGKIWAWLVDTNSVTRLKRFLPDGQLDPEFKPDRVPDGVAFPWIGPLPDDRTFVSLVNRGIVRLLPDGALDPSFQPITSLSECFGDAPYSWSDVLTPLADGGVIVPMGCDFARFRPDGTPDEDWNKARTSFHAADFISAVLHLMVQTDGRFLVVYGPTGRRFPRPRLGRLFADGQLEVEAFQPPNPLASRWVPSLTAEGLTPGRWYALEASDAWDTTTGGPAWWTDSEPFRVPPNAIQPLRIPLQNPLYVPSPRLWRLKEIPAPQ